VNLGHRIEGYSHGLGFTASLLAGCGMECAGYREPPRLDQAYKPMTFGKLSELRSGATEEQRSKAIALRFEDWSDGS
jgi:hypothetical protein